MGDHLLLDSRNYFTFVIGSSSCIELHEAPLENIQCLFSEHGIENNWSQVRHQARPGCVEPSEVFPCKSVGTVLLILHVFVFLTAEANPDTLMTYAFTLQLLD